MKSIIDKLTEYLFKAIENGNYNFIFYLILLIITVLLFLYFKSSIEKRDEKEENKLWDYIIGYTNAIAIFNKYFDKSIEFKEPKHELYILPYVIYKTMKKIMDILENDNGCI